MLNKTPTLSSPAKSEIPGSIIPADRSHETFTSKDKHLSEDDQVWNSCSARVCSVTCY